MRLPFRSRRPDSFEDFTSSVEAHQRTLNALNPGYNLYDDQAYDRALQHAHQLGVACGKVVELFPLESTTPGPPAVDTSNFRHVRLVKVIQIDDYRNQSIDYQL